MERDSPCGCYAVYADEFLDEDCRYPALLKAAEGIRTAWRKSPVMNSAEWHAAVLRLVQYLDEIERGRAGGE